MWPRRTIDIKNCGSKITEYSFINMHNYYMCVCVVDACRSHHGHVYFDS